MLRDLQELEKLYSQQAVPNVIIATTMWSDVRQETGVRREEELKASFWKGMGANGCRTERFRKTHESAWHIIGSLVDHRQCLSARIASQDPEQVHPEDKIVV